MTVGIHDTWAHKTDLLSNVYREILNCNNIKYIDLDSSSPDFWEKIKKIDFFIYRWAHTDYHHQLARTIIPVIEQFYAKPCFPNWVTCWHYDDKIKQSLMLEAMNYPAVKSYVFWDKNHAEEWVNRAAKFPLVFKLKSGSGSLQVKLLRHRAESLKIIDKMFNNGIKPESLGILSALKTKNYDIVRTAKLMARTFIDRYLPVRVRPMWAKQMNYAYFQDFMPGNEYDTRVQITGNRAFAFVRYNRPNDFRASGSNNWDLSHDKIDMEFVKIAFKISRHLGFQSMAYDFIYDNNRKPVIVEISYCFGDYPEFSNGYWDENLIWHQGRFVPQYFELVDLLQRPDLIMPGHVGAQSDYKSVKTG
jgi:glutathione synthase/RimK-type ligase-like ATP-grasp enzyme